MSGVPPHRSEHWFVRRLAEAGVAGGGCAAAQGIVPGRGAQRESGRGGLSSPWLVFAIAVALPVLAARCHDSSGSWHGVILASALPRVSGAQGASCAAAWDGADPAPRRGAASGRGGFPSKAILGSTVSGWGGGPLCVQGEDRAVPGSEGMPRARDTQNTRTPRPGAAVTGQRQQRLTVGLGELTGFGRGRLLGRLPSLLGKRPLFVILPLFAASRACAHLPSGAHGLCCPPGLPYVLAPAAVPSTGASPVARGPLQRGGLGGYGGIQGCAGLGNGPCKCRARWHCPSVPIRSTAASSFRAMGRGHLCSPFSSPSPRCSPRSRDGQRADPRGSAPRGRAEGMLRAGRCHPVPLPLVGASALAKAEHQLQK